MPTGLPERGSRRDSRSPRPVLLAPLLVPALLPLLLPVLASPGVERPRESKR